MMRIRDHSFLSQGILPIYASMKKIITGIAIALVFVVVGGFIGYSIITEKAETSKIMEIGVNTTANPEGVDKERSSRSSSSSSSSSRKKSRDTHYNAVFSYTVEGKNYTIESKNFKNSFDAQDYLEEHNTVRYLEEDPNKARILN